MVTGGMSRETAIVRRAAQKHGVEMVQALVDIVRDPEAPCAARVSAANSVLDRGFGRPEVQIDLRLQALKLENLLQGRFDQMSEEDLKFFADRWDEMQGKLIEHTELTDSTE